MRKNILAVGITLLAVALLFGISFPTGMLFSIPISVLNIILGLITKAPPGLDLRPESANVHIIIDRGVVRASIYQLVFTNSKVILKQLSSVLITVVLPLVLALAGFVFLFIIGALMGGITGFSLQEFLTQRLREKTRSEPRLSQPEKNDIEIDYSAIREVRTIRNRLYLTSENQSLAVSLPKGYSAKLEPSLERIFGSKLVTEESVRSAKTAQK